jgi:hypothetical protein
MEQAGKIKYSTKLLVPMLIGTGNQQKLEEFMELQDNNKRVLFCEVLMKKYNLIPDFKKQLKDPVKSQLYCKQGEEFYQKKEFMKALEYYNRRYVTSTTIRFPKFDKFSFKFIACVLLLLDQKVSLLLIVQLFTVKWDILKKHWQMWSWLETTIVPNTR